MNQATEEKKEEKKSAKSRNKNTIKNASFLKPIKNMRP